MKHEETSPSHGGANMSDDERRERDWARQLALSISEADIGRCADQHIEIAKKRAERGSLAADDDAWARLDEHLGRPAKPHEKQAFESAYLEKMRNFAAALPG
ncbi:MAG: hypothetical protein M3Y87_03785 [Myxococcota bacterium]|nr:hypothetical protein [Myxococcota bacterium]